MSSSSCDNSFPAEALPKMPEQGRPVAARRHSYSQILKSSVLIGGSSLVNIGFGILRTKAMALFLGPAGVGLMGLYSSIIDLTHSVAGMGINSSGVRQIAEAVGSGQTESIARTVTALRRISVLLGALGAVLLVAFSRPISLFTFGTDERTAGVALLSLAVFFRLVSGGQGALIQGMRRISDLARMGVLGALFGTLTSILLIYFFHEQGIVPSLVGVAWMSLLTSWWFSRKVPIQRHSMTMAQMGQEAAGLLKLGFAFMASGLLMSGAAYAIRLILLRKVGFEAAGLFQSAWSLGGLYVGFILQAMGADFYPRLTAVAKDNSECNRLVNEQAQVSLLLAGPGVLATLTLAPLIIFLFYSAKFNAAVGILRWICLGATLQVVAWPMGFILLAKGAQKVFFLTELAAALVQVGLAWMLVKRFQLPGAGMAFFGLYVWHGLVIYWIVRRLSQFRWSAANWKLGRLFLPLIGAVFCGFCFLPFWLATAAGIVATVGSGVYSVRVLLNILPLDRIPLPVRRLLVRLRFAPSSVLEHQ